MDEEITIDDLKRDVKEFCEKRDWDQFHNPKNLAIALTIEAGELLEYFRWDDGNDAEERFKDSVKRGEIEDEVADVLYFIVRLAQRYDIDLSRAFNEKMEENKEKYPVEEAKGSAKKYTEI